MVRRIDNDAHPKNALIADLRKDCLITFENAALRVRDRRVFEWIDWRIDRHQNWAVLGPNGAGKSTLLNALIGKAAVVGGTIGRHHPSAMPAAIGHVSLETHHHLVAADQARDTARYFSGRFDDTLIVKHLLDTAAASNPLGRDASDVLKNTFQGLTRVMRQPFRTLSVGEARQVLIARAVLASQGLLLMDEPFEGLDACARQRLQRIITRLVEKGFQIILATHRVEHIVSAIDHVLCVRDGTIIDQGSREHLLKTDRLQALYRTASSAGTEKWPEAFPGGHLDENFDTALIDIRQATVRYGPKVVFANLDWRVKPGEHWAVVGPNGAGKSTLMRLIAADHPQAYSNEVYIFGKRRGSGESIWEIKQALGVVSAELQIDYRAPATALEVVVSGFFDSIGLYRCADSQQVAIARGWMDRLQMPHLKPTPFSRLSSGEQRMVLIGRAMVKSPRLLVLDEPLQGLDPANRRRVLSIVEKIGSRTPTQIVYVTHHTGEMPACIQHILRLDGPKSHSEL